MLRRWTGILSGRSAVAVNQGRGKAYSLSAIGGYYNDLTGKVSPDTMLDERGVPVNIIAGGARAYAWITIFQYALGIYDLYLLNGDQEKLDRFMMLAGLALEAQDEAGKWDCRASIGSSRGSASCMGQGQAVSILLRAHIVSCDSRFADAARRAADFMLRPVEEGGTAYYGADGVSFEKYPPMGGKRSSVLNGWAFALFGLYDYVLFSGEARYGQVLNRSLRTLEVSLAGYDRGYWSNYDLTGVIASPAYHHAHIALLDVLGEMSGLPGFALYADRFRAYQRDPRKKCRAIARKFMQKMTEDTDALLVR
jgi:hypothetical protein